MPQPDADEPPGDAEPWCDNCGKSVFACQCHACAVCGREEPDVELVLTNGAAFCRDHLPSPGQATAP